MTDYLSAVFGYLDNPDLECTYQYDVDSHQLLVSVYEGHELVPPFALELTEETLGKHIARLAGRDTVIFECLYSTRGCIPAFPRPLG